MSINRCDSKNISNNAAILHTFFILFFIFILPLVACPLWGQVVQKKALLPADYHLWSELILENISPNEQWASCRLSYENNIDSLVVQNTNNQKRYSFPNIQSSKFTTDNFFVAQNREGLFILNLQSGKQELIKDVSQFSYSAKTNLLIIAMDSGQKENHLLLRTPDGITVKKVHYINDFSLSPTGQELIYSTYEDNKYGLWAVNLGDPKNEKPIIEASQNLFAGFSWQKESRSVAFISLSEEQNVRSLFHYIFKNDTLFELQTNSNSIFPKKELSINDVPYIVISDDMQKVFFNVTARIPPPAETLQSDVEIWNGNDKWVYLDESIHGQYKTTVKNALWLPESNTFKLLTTDELPKIALTGDKQYAILSNPKDYEPQLELYSPRDYYLLNLKTFEKNIFLKKLPDEKGNVNPSPSGNYISYFKEGAWWIYSIRENKHTNITSTIPVRFKSKQELFTPESVAGNPGWTPGDKEILIYDQYDIWAIRPDGSSARRLTHGRELKIRYRLAALPDKVYHFSIYQNSYLEIYDLDKEIYLRADGDDGKSGYFRWNKKSKEQKIVYRDSYIDQLLYNAKKQNFIIREQKFDVSPQLVKINKSKQYDPFYKSNKQQQNYFWGKSELIRYQTSKGVNLKGVLIYPANYNPAKKYPMVVHIYELKSKELHHYKNPTLYNENGFNETHFNLQGYFILLPDIIHEYQNVGGSTVDCVTASVKKVLEKKVIDPDKIGLVGFSFGGYETSFIVTQTNLFAAAIAGGAFTDLNSLYFTLGKGTGKPEMWRFQSTYFMLGKTPYEAPDLYNSGSPIFHVKNVETPLLLWTGKADPQVDPNQSMEFYLALRRFGKKNILLQYPGEGHVVANKINQMDISIRIQDWFDYHLKSIPSEWVNEGLK